MDMPSRENNLEDEEHMSDRESKEKCVLVHCKEENIAPLHYGNQTVNM